MIATRGNSTPASSDTNSYTVTSISRESEIPAVIIPLPAESPSEPIPGLEGSGILAAGVSSHQQALTLPQRPYPVAVSPSQLTEGELTAVLQSAGWPEELIPAALSVAWCESKWSPSAIGDSGSSVGLFQLNKQTWFIYA